ncbi:tRNA pseudouridine(13) synthase TruD, partial [Escherichia coli]
MKVVPNEKKLRIGQLVGNKFQLKIRNVENPDSAAKRAEKILEELKNRGVPNYYGYQRFGKNRPNTHLVGKALIKEGVKAAVDWYIG